MEESGEDVSIEKSRRDYFDEIEALHRIIQEQKREIYYLRENQQHEKGISQTSQEFELHVHIAKRISKWKIFGRLLDLKEYRIKQIELSPQCSSLEKKNLECIKIHCQRNKDKAVYEWQYWKNILRNFEDGKNVSYEMEKEIRTLLTPEVATEICHDSVYKDTDGCSEEIFLFHHNYTEHIISLPSSFNKFIEVNVGAGKTKTISYETYKGWINSKELYESSYTVFFKTMQIYDFSFNRKRECKVLETMKRFFESQGDEFGFAIKGYSLVNHYLLFGDKVFKKAEREAAQKDIFCYFAKDNVLLYLTLCDNYNDLANAVHGSWEKVQFSRSIHGYILNGSTMHVSVALYDNQCFEEDLKNSDIFKVCREAQLVLPKKHFADLGKFSSWYETVVSSRIRKSRANKTKQEDEETSVKKARQLKRDIVANMALQYVDLPTFASYYIDQMKELGKVVLLTQTQTHILYSGKMRVFIKGLYGSGKSMLLKRKFDYAMYHRQKGEMFFLICHDQQSEFAEQMKKWKMAHVITNCKLCENVLVCNSKDLCGNSMRLSALLESILETWGDKGVNIFIDEFDGSYLDVEEAERVKSILDTKFQESFLYIATQSIRRYVGVPEKSERFGFRYDLLEDDGCFTSYELDMFLRFSIENAKFITETIDSLKGEYNCLSKQVEQLSKVYFVSCNNVTKVCDLEYGVQKTKYDEEPTMSIFYDYRVPEKFGHNISSDKVKIYSTAKSLCKHNVTRISYFRDVFQHIFDNYNDEADSLVISTRNEKLFKIASYVLDNLSVSYTDNISAFSKKEGSWQVLLSNYASLRGFEFSRFVFLVSPEDTLMKVRLPESLSRVTANLFIVIDSNPTADKHMTKLLNTWKLSNHATWHEVVYECCSSQSDSIHEQPNVILMKRKIEFPLSTKEPKLNFPWQNVQIELIEKSCPRTAMHRAFEVIFLNDNASLFDKFVRLKRMRHISERIDVPNYTFARGRNLLHQSACFGTVGIMTKLIENYKMCVDKKDEDENAPIHLAVIYNKPDALSKLVEKNACINLTDRSGGTALHLALKYNYVKIVSILIDHNADTTVKNKDGYIPTNMIQQQQQQQAYSDNNKRCKKFPRSLSEGCKR